MKTMQSEHKVFSSSILSKSTSSFLMFLMLLISLTSCLDDDLSLVSEIQQDFVGITKVEVEGDFLDVEYTGVSGVQNLNLDVALLSNSSKKFEVDYRVVGSTLRVFVTTNNRLFSGSAKGEGTIKLTGPRNMQLDLDVDSGKLTVQNVVTTSSEFEVESGQLIIRNVTIPNIEVDIASGVGMMQDVVGNLKAELGSGKLELLQVEGNIEAEVASGEIILKDVNGFAKANTASGKIEMNNVKSIGEVSVATGQLFATNSGLSVQTGLKATSGNIYIQTFSNLRSFNYNITTGSSGIAKVGDAQSSGSLTINNGASQTIRGEVTSGKIEIVN